MSAVMKTRACRLRSRRSVIAAGGVALLLSACASTVTSAAKNGANALPQAGWQTDFHLENRKLSDVGEAKYFVLKPGFQLTLKSASSILHVTVLDETKVLGGIRTRVVEEREETNGQLAEIARNYFAIDPATGTFELKVAKDKRNNPGFPLEIATNVPRSDYIVLEAKIFPGINLYWIGSILMMTGLLMAWWFKYKENEEWTSAS